MQLTSGPLVAFLKAVGLSAVANETPKTLSRSEDISGQLALGLQFDVVERLVLAYGDFVHAEILLGNLTELKITRGITPEIFQEGAANLTMDNSYELRLTIDKEALLNEVIGSEAARGTVHYFFATSVKRILTEGLDQLEQAIWNDAPEFRRLLIGDFTLLRSGPVFQVVGGNNLTGELPPLEILPDSISASIERMRTSRLEQISWDHQWVEKLTPVQLQLDGEPGNSSLERLLSAAYIQLCLLYTCDRARRRRDLSSGWVAQPEYRGGGGPVIVPLQEAHPIPAQITAATVSGFAGLVDWCYRLRDEGTTSDWAAERLQFTQVRIAQLLKPEHEANRLATLVRQVDDVVEALDDQWRAFIDDRFGQYLDKERHLEELVNEVVDEFGEKTTELTKSLSDTLLAAVAALIGSAIAAAFKTPFNSALFRVGVLTYAGYVLIFPCFYRLSSQLGQFLESSGAFEHERTRFNALIGSKKTNSIVGNRVAKAKARYWRWFVLTAAGYVVAIAGAILAAMIVPAIV